MTQAKAKYCPCCGSALTPTARYPLATLLPWAVTLVAVFALAIVAFGARSDRAPALGPAAPDGTIPAPDISNLSPDERVDRLFNRVMSLSAAGERDSVAFFAPMAANAFAALAPLTVHRHYDLGLVLLVSGDAPGARAQADTILAQSATHLLGLALAMRAAAAAGDTAQARRFGARFTAALVGERAKGLAEYAEHAADIADAVEEAAGRRPLLGAPRVLP